MASESEPPVPPLTAILPYLMRDPRYINEKPYRLIDVQPTANVPKTNLQFVNRQVSIRDLRQQQITFTLDTNGFQLFHWPSTISMEAGYAEIEAYCKQMADLLQEELAAEKIFIYEFRFRSKDLSTGHFIVNADSNEELSAAESFPGNPAQVIHTDHSQSDGLGRIRKHLTKEEAEKYLSSQYHIRCINIWRSFNNTSQDMPLAFCMPNSIKAEDIQGIDKVTTTLCSESYYLYYNESHQWYWASDTSPSEVLAFTTWDSRISEEATKCAFHTAFPNPTEGDHSPRRSLEVRMIVINQS